MVKQIHVMILHMGSGSGNTYRKNNMGSRSGARQYPDKTKAVEENSDKRENDEVQKLIPLMASTNPPSHCSRAAQARRPHRTHGRQTIPTVVRNHSRPHPCVRQGGQTSGIREELRAVGAAGRRQGGAARGRGSRTPRGTPRGRR